MIAAPTTTKARPRVFTIDRGHVYKHGKRYMPLPASQSEWLRLIETTYSTGCTDTLMGVLSEITSFELSSQPKEAAATSGAQAAPHPCSLRPKTKGAIDSYEAAANGSAKKIGTILDTTVPVVSLGQGDSSKNIYAEDLIDPSRKPSTANGEVR